MDASISRADIDSSVQKLREFFNEQEAQRIESEYKCEVIGAEMKRNASLIALQLKKFHQRRKPNR